MTTDNLAAARTNILELRNSGSVRGFPCCQKITESTEPNFSSLKIFNQSMMLNYYVFNTHTYAILIRVSTFAPLL